MLRKIINKTGSLCSYHGATIASLDAGAWAVAWKKALFSLCYIIVTFVTSTRPVSQFIQCQNAVPRNVVFHFLVFKEDILMESNCLTYATYSGQCFRNSKFTTNKAIIIIIIIIYHR